MAPEIPELTLIFSQPSPAGYRLELRFLQPGSQGEVDPAAGQALLLPLDPAEFKLLEEDHVAYGKKLAEWLFALEPVRTAFAQARAVAESNDQPLRVRLQAAPEAREIHALHWEALFEPDGSAALFTSQRLFFSRYLSSADFRPVRLTPRHALRALVAIANPSDLDVYSLAEVKAAVELPRVQVALAGIEVDPLVAQGEQHVTLEAISERLRQQHYDILYIVAHGSTRKEESFLWLESTTGETARVSGEMLATELEKLAEPPLLVALLACESAGAPASPALAAIGPRLAVAGIPAVLAMQGKISVESGGKFMGVFFSELNREGLLDAAAAVARNAILAQPDFWMPVLYTRLKEGLIYGEAAPITIRPPELRKLNRGLLAAIAGVAVLVIGLGIFLAVQNRRTQEALKATPTPSVMTKGFNVAIAQFSVVDAQGQPLNSSDGQAMADYLYDRLGGELAAAEDLDEELWPAAFTGPILGEDHAARRAAAEARAIQINAHVLIYGQVKVVAGIGSFTPEFYVNYQGFERNAPEIADANILGDALEVVIPFKRDQVAAGENPALVARSRALGFLAVGLGYYAFDRYEQALNYFDQAVKTPGWLDEAGKEIAYLMRGNARVRLIGIQLQRLDITPEELQTVQADLPLAQADYQKAWEVTEGTYGRALIGLGGVAYLQSIQVPGVFTPETVNEALLAQAEAYFKQALALPGQPPEYNLPAKAAFSLGQLYQVRGEAFSQPEQYDQAEAEYQQVIQAYQAGAVALQEFATQAYARLGLLAINRGELENAFNQFEKALEIASPYYQAIYTSSIAVTYFEYGIQAAEAGDEPNARARLQRAETLLEEALARAKANADQTLVNEYEGYLKTLREEYGKYLEP